MAVDLRKHAAVVRRYLEALERYQPKRGRKHTPESIRKRLAVVNAKMRSAPPVQRLGLVQERLDLEKAMSTLNARSDVAKLEEEFVKVAKAYSDRKGISYTAWRELGVSAETLRRAGVPRTRRTQ